MRGEMEVWWLTGDVHEGGMGFVVAGDGAIG